MRKKLKSVARTNPSVFGVATMCTLAFTGGAVLFALYLPILDCDETFNFWEPLHYTMFGWGLQTWEYSPNFALRSWLYITVHRLLLLPARACFERFHKSVYFYSLKILLGTITGMSVIRFRNKVEQAIGKTFATTLSYVILGGSGLYASAVSFLPTSFSMILQFLAMSDWLSICKDNCGPRWRRIIALNIVSHALGWPFAILSALPMAIHFLSLADIQLCVFGLACALSTSLMAVMVDSYFYGRLTFPQLNLIRYNVFPAEGTGAHLYGTEPPIFMLKNLFLGFNIVFLAALLSPVMCFLKRNSKDLPKKGILWMAPAMTWVLLLFWSQVPHKEERFLFHLYPYILLSATIVIDIVYHMIARLCSRSIANLFYSVFFALYFGLSAARSLALFTLYSAPRQLHDDFRISTIPPNSCGMCYSDEWYRFPSSFFLPDSVTTPISFIHAPGMSSQLPLPFRSTQASMSSFNNKNLANANQFTDASKCKFFITSDAKQINRTIWRPLHSHPIIAPENSEWYFRAFYVPYFSHQRLKYVDFAMYNTHDVSHSQ